MTQSHNRSPWLIWGLLAVFYLYELMLRGSPGVMTNDLMAQYHIGSAKLGLLSSAWYYPYVLLQIPCGMILDAFGVRWVITISACASSFGIFLFSQGTSFQEAIFARFLLGAGSACVFISCLKVASEWFAKENFGKVCGFTNIMGTLGGLCAGYPLALVISKIGWQQTCLYASWIGVVITVLIFFVVRDKTKHHYTKTDKRNFLVGLKKLVRSKDMWLVATFNALMYVPITAFTDLWAVPFLKNAYDLPTTKAASISVLIYVGSAIGSSFWPRVADAWGSYLKVMRVACLITIGLFCLILLGDNIPLMMMIGTMLAAGMAISGKILSFAWVHAFCDPKEVGVGLGFTNAVTMMSGLIFQPLLGYVLDLFWQGNCTEAGVRIYSASAYSYAIALIPLCLFATFFLLFFIKETHRRHTDDGYLREV